MTLIILLLSALFVALNVADVILTNRVLASGHGMEGNPIAQFFQKYLGSYWWVSKILIVPPIWAALAAGTLLWALVLAALCAFYGWVVWNNYTVSKAITPKS